MVLRAHRQLNRTVLTEWVDLPVNQLTDLLATLQAQPTDVRERFLRRFVEAWLLPQREPYDAEQRGEEDGYGAGGRQTLSLVEVIFAQAFQMDMLMNVLERPGLPEKAEVLVEVKRVPAKAPTAR